MSKAPDTWLAEEPHSTGATPGGFRYALCIMFLGNVLMGTLSRRAGFSELLSCGRDSQSASTFQLPGMCCVITCLKGYFWPIGFPNAFGVPIVGGPITLAKVWHLDSHLVSWVFHQVSTLCFLCGHLVFVAP